MIRTSPTRYQVYTTIDGSKVVLATNCTLTFANRMVDDLNRSEPHLGYYREPMPEPIRPTFEKVYQR